MLSQGFFTNALLAGTFVALACGVVGYVVILRAQLFAGDALSHVAFTGAVAAGAIGLDARIGLFGTTIVVGLFLGAISGRRQIDDAPIGIALAWILGVGVLCISLAGSGTGGGVLGARTLFGSIFGLSASSARLAAAIGVLIVLAVAALGRPLIFASIDPLVARARGVPTTAVGLAFLALVGATAAEATQAVGALLLLGLMAAPAGAAHTLSANPVVGLALAGALAVAAMWIGLVVSYHFPNVPPSTAIVGVAAATYGVAMVLARSRLDLDARRSKRQLV